MRQRAAAEAGRPAEMGAGGSSPSERKGGRKKKPHMLVMHTMYGTLGIWMSGRFDTINSYVNLETFLWHAKIISDIYPECRACRV